MVFHSKFEPLEPNHKLDNSLAKFFWLQLDLHARKALIVDHESGRVSNGAQLKSVGSRIASYLLEELKMQPGETCVYFYPNCDRLIQCVLGVLFAGCGVCVGSHLDPSEEHQYMIEAVRPKVVFAQSSLLESLLQVQLKLAQKGQHFKLCVMDDEAADDQLEASQVLGFERDLLRHEPSEQSLSELPVKVDPNGAAFILLSSGSTGHPKPVVRSQRNSLYVCHSFTDQVCAKLWDLNEKSVVAGHLQLDHGTGIFNLKMCLAKGLKVILMDGYDQQTMLEAIQRHRITDCSLGSAYLQNLMTTPESVLNRYDLSSMRNFISVGSPLASHQTAIDFMDKYPKLSVRQAFGATETGFMSIVARDESRKDSRSVGWLLPNFTVKLLDANGEEIRQVEESGEMQVAGPTVSPGYLGVEFAKQSRASFQSDGFYRGFDQARFELDGRLKIEGRLCEVLCLSDGWKVLPFEIESLLLKHKKIREAAVIGIPHPKLPTCHAPRAYIVPEESYRDTLSEREVFDWAAQRLSEPKHLLGGIRFMQQLPRVSRLGKVDKRALRKLDGY